MNSTILTLPVWLFSRHCNLPLHSCGLLLWTTTLQFGSNGVGVRRTRMLQCLRKAGDAARLGSRLYTTSQLFTFAAPGGQGQIRVDLVRDVTSLPGPFVWILLLKNPPELGESYWHLSVPRRTAVPTRYPTCLFTGFAYPRTSEESSRL